MPASEHYSHSVTLDRDKCKGCTNCIKRCPTEAIRVREGKATIIEQRCIDCGECIRVCPYHAKVARTDPLATINRFKHRIALPAPTLYGQFKKLQSIDRILWGLKNIGFDAVFEVALGADVVSYYTKKLMTEGKTLRKPLISSACPAVVRLIQVRFPELLEHIIDIQSPMEVAARIAKDQYCEQTGADPKDVGVFFITPCAAKMTSIRAPLSVEKSAVDGAISILEMYGLLSSQLSRPEADDEVPQQKASFLGVSWANAGGESIASGCEATLAVDGVDNVIRVLEEIENGNLNDLDFFEALACNGGCVGGPLVFENGYVAKNRIRKLAEGLERREMDADLMEEYLREYDIRSEKPIKPKAVMQLDDNLAVALKKMEMMEKLTKELPGLDCGSCGAPSCQALAEDIVRGQAVEMDCIFKMREKVQSLAQQMIDLSNMQNL